MPTKKPKKSIKPGDLFQLGEHLLLCGDALDTELVNKFLSGRKVTAVICDPPYGISYVENKQGFKQNLGCKNGRVIANDQKQTELEYLEFSQQWLKNLKPHLARKNSIYIFNSDRMIFALRQALLDVGYKFSQLLIWVKNHSVVGRLDYLPQHELVAYGWYGIHKFKRSKDKSVLCYPKPSKSKLHPTMKPVGLLRQLILNSTSIGDVVCDLFGGSGSLMLSAEQTKRKCLMIELDPEYCQIIIDRFEKSTGIKAQKIIINPKKYV
ncbi:site-specific DNA-methyltransferase [Candidatus Kuenenbacteria bacterium]|nr:site-specific DNA-methyltransferase [Candidatus Kuenenbacteria bacterium]